MKPKILIALITFTMLAAIVFGCAGPSSTPVPEPAPVPEIEPATAPTAAPAPTPSPAPEPATVQVPRILGVYALVVALDTVAQAPQACGQG